jgi:NTE family protein
MTSRALQLVFALLLAGCAGSLAGRAPLPEPSSAPIERVQRERPVVALVLGSGGARGFAHVGVIKSLEAEGIQPDIVVGASSGAIVAALYAAGLNGQQLQAIANQLDESDLIDISPFDGFRIRGERIARFVTETLDHRPMEALPRAFAVVATDAETGSMTVFNRGDPGLAVRASSSVPRLFVPPTIRGRQYIDGGLVSPVPVKLARAMGADIVIAVDISRFSPAVAPGPTPASAASTDPGARSARRARLEAELAQASVVIRPVLARTRMLDFDYKQAHLAAGEAAVHGELAKLRQVLATARSAGNGSAAQ